jgi:hypothetical protein
LIALSCKLKDAIRADGATGEERNENTRMLLKDENGLRPADLVLGYLAPTWANVEGL